MMLMEVVIHVKSPLAETGQSLDSTTNGTLLRGRFLQLLRRWMLRSGVIIIANVAVIVLL